MKKIKDKEKKAFQNFFNNFDRVRNKLAIEFLSIDDLTIDLDTSDMFTISIEFLNKAKTESQKQTANKVFKIAKRLFAFHEVYKERIKVLMFRNEMLEVENLKLKGHVEIYKEQYEYYKEQYEKLLSDAV